MSLDQYEQCPICCTDLVETKTSKALRWGFYGCLFAAGFLLGSAVGFMQGSTYVAQEIDSRFDGVANP